MNAHTKDEDCTVDPNTGCCATCGTYHGDPCEFCGKRAFHMDNCPGPALTDEMEFGTYGEPDIDDSVHCCPNCERPNQFGELCDTCEKEFQLEAQEIEWRAQ